jgi:DNA-binding NtrC family response regulator
MKLMKPPVTILVVDDDEMLLRVVRQVLGSAGYTVITAPDAGVGWNLILKTGQDIDLLLTDIGMPGPFDGVELAQRVRKHQPELPILLMTGTTLLEKHPTSLVQYWKPMLLSKPFSVDRVLAMVQEHLESRQLACQSRN